MAFSYSIQVDGIETVNFNGLKIRESTDGIGISGISTAELTFTVPPSEYALYSVSAAAEVKIFFIDSAGKKDQVDQTFYISSRSSRNKTVSFKCYDKMMMTDKAFTAEDDLFINDSISAYNVLARIVSICGFSDYGLFNLDDAPDILIPKEKAIGRSCRNLLEMISSAWCGYFRTNIENNLIFIPFGKAYIYLQNTEYAFHSAITENNTKIITQVIMNGNGEEFISGAGNGVLNTIRISSELASMELASNILQRIYNYKYQSWECSKFIFTNIYHGDFMTPTVEITFENGEKRIANYIEKIFTSYGIVFKCGANDFSENEIEYKGSYARDISSRIQDGEKLGNNTMITRYQGIIHLAENEKAKKISLSANNNDSVTKFGYSPATSDGIVEFAGAILDGKYPSIEVNSNATEFRLKYGDTIKNFALKWNGDNVTVEKEV